MDASGFTAADFALIGITPESIAAAFGFGFGTIVFFWFLGYCIKAALAVVRKL